MPKIVITTIIQSAQKLKAILKWGVGVDSIDIAATNAAGLPVCHCPSYGASTTADHAFALLIALARKLIPLVNVKNFDALEAMGLSTNRYPYGHLPYSLDG
jgi:D-3-phosphoglycerate dehydrogenase